MESKYVDTICSQIYRRFPEVDGARPKVQAQAPAGSETVNYLLTFKGSGKTEDGRSISRIVRVVASERGKILKITTSR